MPNRNVHRDRSRFRGFRAIMLVLGVMLFCGCKNPMNLSDLEGRWLDRDQDRHLEFTPHHLMVEVHQGPADVVAFQASLKSDLLQLEPLSWPWVNLFPAPGGGQRPLEEPLSQAWPLSRQESALLFESQGYRWILKKAGPPDTNLGRVPQELVGLWRQLGEDDLISYFEFTPWSTLVQLTWKSPVSSLAPPGTDAPQSGPAWLFSTAEWWEVTSPESGVLLLEGLELEDGPKSQRATYQIDGSVLTLRYGSRRYTLRQTDRVEFDTPIRVENTSQDS